MASNLYWRDTAGTTRSTPLLLSKPSTPAINIRDGSTTKYVGLTSEFPYDFHVRSGGTHYYMRDGWKNAWGTRGAISTNLPTLTWTGSYLVAVPANNTTSTSYRSNDLGVTWTAGGSMPAAGNWTTPAWNGSALISINTSSATQGARSTDHGATWSAITLPAGSSTWAVPSYDGSYWVTVAYEPGAANPHTARSSDNGVTWTSGGNIPNLGSPSYRSTNYCQMTVAAGSYVVALAGYGAPFVCARTSDHGSTWALVGAVSNAYELLSMGDNAAVYDGTNIVVVYWITDQGYVSYSSDFGATWTQAVGNNGAFYNAYLTKVSSNLLVTTCRPNGYIGTSTDHGVTWTVVRPYQYGTAIPWNAAYTGSVLVGSTSSGSGSGYTKYITPP